MGDDLDDEDEKEDSKWLMPILIVVGGIWGLALFIGLLGLCGENMKTLSDFGGWFGAVSSLFSSLALGGAIYAVFLQRQELKLARKEHRAARIAQESNADSQKKMVRLQAFTAMLDERTQLFSTASGNVELYQKTFGLLSVIISHRKYTNEMSVYDVLYNDDIDPEVAKRLLIFMPTGASHDNFQKVKFDILKECERLIRKSENTLDEAKKDIETLQTEINKLLDG